MYIIYTYWRLRECIDEQCRKLGGRDVS